MDSKILSIIFICNCLLSCGIVNAENATCDSCSDCSTKLNGDYDFVKLTQDIVNRSSTCIQLTAGYVEFDCQGHLIDGDEFAGAGINVADDFALWGATVKNCVVTDFSYGIRLLNAYQCTLENNILRSNNDTGIRTDNSFMNTINNNTITSNEMGIIISSANHPNYIYNNVVSYNSWIGVYLGNADYTKMNSNEICFNLESDIWSYGSDDMSGNNNTCDTPDAWNDTNTIGCTYSCSPLTTTTTSSTTTTILEECELPGDYPVCGYVTLGEVVDFICLWAQGQASLSDVVALISAWAS